MKNWGRLLAFAMAALSGIMFADAAFAQATRTWVSGVGDDANPCSRTAPCKTFAGAISKTAAGGEINTMDAGGYGAVTITKSITISSEGDTAGVLASSTNGITVNAGANDVVVLRGLDIDGAPLTAPGHNGIRFLAGGALHVQDSQIRNFKASSAGSGILFAPSGASSLYVTNTKISNNGVATVGTGIRIIPSSGGSAKVVIDKANVEGNTAGIRVDSSATAGALNVVVTDSIIAGNTLQGIMAFAPTTGGNVQVMVRDVVLSSNSGKGLRAEGSKAVIRVGGSVVTGNGEGTIAVSGGSILSYGNNQIDGNVNDGATPGTIQFK